MTERARLTKKGKRGKSQRCALGGKKGTLNTKRKKSLRTKKSSSNYYVIGERAQGTCRKKSVVLADESGESRQPSLMVSGAWESTKTKWDDRVPERKLSEEIRRPAHSRKEALEWGTRTVCLEVSWSYAYGKECLLHKRIRV